MFDLYMQTPNIFQTTPRRQSAESREDTTPRKPLGSPSRAASTPTRTGHSENRYDVATAMQVMSWEQFDHI